MSQMINYNLSMTIDTHETLKRIAEEEGTSVANLLRKAAKFYLFARSIKNDPESRLLVERNGEIAEIVMDLV